MLERAKSLDIETENLLHGFRLTESGAAQQCAWFGRLNLERRTATNRFISDSSRKASAAFFTMIIIKSELGLFPFRIGANPDLTGGVRECCLRWFCSLP